MNRYGRMALDHNRQNLPEAFAAIPNPDRFFTEAGEEIEAAIASVQDQIVGQRQPGETPKEYQLRSSRSRSMAEELVLADHYLLAAEPERETDPDTTGDPDLAAYYRDLDAVNEAIASLYS